MNNKIIIAVGVVGLAGLGFYLLTKKTAAASYVCPIDGLKFASQSELDAHTVAAHPGTYIYSTKVIGSVTYESRHSNNTNKDFVLLDGAGAGGQEVAWITEANLAVYLAGGWVAATHAQWIP